jgi:hypothetical protein
MIKELNNCISHLKRYISGFEHRMEEREQLKAKRGDGLPPKYKKLSVRNPKKAAECSH